MTLMMMTTMTRLKMMIMMKKKIIMVRLMMTVSVEMTIMPLYSGHYPNKLGKDQKPL